MQTSRYFLKQSAVSFLNVFYCIAYDFSGLTLTRTLEGWPLSVSGIEEYQFMSATCNLFECLGTVGRSYPCYLLEKLHSIAHRLTNVFSISFLSVTNQETAKMFWPITRHQALAQRPSTCISGLHCSVSLTHLLV